MPPVFRHFASVCALAPIPAPAPEPYIRHADTITHSLRSSQGSSAAQDHSLCCGVLQAQWPRLSRPSMNQRCACECACSCTSHDPSGIGRLRLTDSATCSAKQKITRAHVCHGDTTIWLSRCLERSCSTFGAVPRSRCETTVERQVLRAIRAVLRIARVLGNQFPACKRCSACVRLTAALTGDHSNMLLHAAGHTCGRLPAPASTQVSACILSHADCSQSPLPR